MIPNWLAVSPLCAGGLIGCHDEPALFKPKGLTLAAYDSVLISLLCKAHREEEVDRMLSCME